MLFNLLVPDPGKIASAIRQVERSERDRVEQVMTCVHVHGRNDREHMHKVPLIV